MIHHFNSKHKTTNEKLVNIPLSCPAILGARRCGLRPQSQDRLVIWPLLRPDTAPGTPPSSCRETRDRARLVTAWTAIQSNMGFYRDGGEARGGGKPRTLGRG